MPNIDIPVRKFWLRCPEGRLVVRPSQADGNEPLSLDDDNAVLVNDEVQIGVRSQGAVLVTLRDEVKPCVFEREINVRGSAGLWIGSIEGVDGGVDLAATPGRYRVTGWFHQDDAPHGRLLVLGVRPI